MQTSIKETKAKFPKDLDFHKRVIIIVRLYAMTINERHYAIVVTRQTVFCQYYFNGHQVISSI